VHILTSKLDGPGLALCGGHGIFPYPQKVEESHNDKVGNGLPFGAWCLLAFMVEGICNNEDGESQLGLQCRVCVLIHFQESLERQVEVFVAIRPVRVSVSSQDKMLGDVA